MTTSITAPSQPTATTIVTEAYNRYGVKTPTAEQLSRGINFGLENVKDIMCLKSRKWKMLRAKYCMMLAPNMSIQTPYLDDMGQLIELAIWESDDIERAHGSGFSSIINWPLNASETRTREQLQGRHLVSYSQAADDLAFPTGNQLCDIAQIISYHPTTQAAEMVGNQLFQVPASGTSYYRTLSSRLPITIKKLSSYNQDVMYPSTKGKPTQAYMSTYMFGTFGDSEFSTYEDSMLYFDKTADKPYFIEWYYYADLQKISLSSDRYVNILRRWKPLLTQGVYIWLLGDNSDDRYKNESTIFNQMLTALAGQEIDGLDVSDIQRTVSD